MVFIHSMSLLLNIPPKFHLRSNVFDYYKFIKNYSILTRNYCSSKTISSAKESHEENSTKTFHTIYRFPYIRFGAAINKFKWPQTLITAFVFPNSAAAYFHGIIEFETLLGIIFAGFFVTGNVYVYGSLFNEAVGFLYVSEDGETLKISYLDFWGTRVDKEIPVEDVMPLADCPRIPTDYVFRKIHFYSTEKLKLKLFLKMGIVTDPVKFVRVFGDYTKH